VQTFYQPLFSHSPLAIFFLSAIFSLPNTSHTKKPKVKAKGKKPLFLLQGSIINSHKWDGAAERRDIVTGETCVPASLNVNNL
jgi:hypothetical protein